MFTSATRLPLRQEHFSCWGLSALRHTCDRWHEIKGGRPEKQAEVKACTCCFGPITTWAGPLCTRRRLSLQQPRAGRHPRRRPEGRSYRRSSSGRKKPAVPVASTPPGEEKCPAGRGEAGCGEHRGLCSLGDPWGHGGGSSTAGRELAKPSEQTSCPPSTVPKGGPDQQLT